MKFIGGIFSVLTLIFSLLALIEVFKLPEYTAEAYLILALVCMFNAVIFGSFTKNR